MKDLLQRIGLLTLSSILAYLIGAINLWLMVFLFDQATVGYYSVFLSYALIALTIVLLSYDVAIPNVEDELLPEVVMTCVVVMVVMSIVLGSLLWVLEIQYVLFIVLLVVALALVKIAEMINIRAQQAMLMAVFRVFPHIVMSLLLMISVMVDDARTPGRLVAIHVLAFSLSALMYAIICIKPLWGSLSFAKWLSHCRNHQANPRYIMPADFLNTAAYQVPVIIIEHYFNAAIAAQYSVVLRFCFAPINMLGSAIGQVYHGDIAHIKRTEQGSISQRFWQLSYVLWGAAVFVGMVIYFLFPPAFTFFLGEEWGLAGTFAQVLTPLFIVMLVVAPLSASFYVMARQRYYFYSQLGYFLIACVSYLLAVQWANILLGVMLFSGLSVARYLLMYREIVTLSQGQR